MYANHYVTVGRRPRPAGPTLTLPTDSHYINNVKPYPVIAVVVPGPLGQHSHSRQHHRRQEDYALLDCLLSSPARWANMHTHNRQSS